MLLSLNLIISLFMGVKLFMSVNKNQRGTNKVTRLVRDTSANFWYKTLLRISILITVIFIPLALIFRSYVCFLPSLLVAIGCMVFMRKSTMSAQRVKDARGVTKGTLEVGGQVVGAAGDVAATAMAATGIGAPAAAAVKAGTKALGKGMSAAGAQMEDVEGLDVDISQEMDAIAGSASNLIGQRAFVKNPEAFIAAATRAGIPVEGRDLGQVALEVLQYAPQVTLSQLPEEMSIEDKAMRVMAGEVS